MALKQLLFTGVIIVAACSAVAVEEHRLARERNAATMFRMQAANARAERDTIRALANVSGALAASLGDSLHLFQRRVLQMSQRGDALDAALEGERTGNYRIAATVAPLTATANVPSVIDSGTHVRRAHVYIRQSPYSVEADVDQSPRSDSTVSLALNIRLDTLPLTVRLTFAPADSLGVRSASFEASRHSGHRSGSIISNRTRRYALTNRSPRHPPYATG